MFKKFKELGLTSQYRKDKETRRFCRLLLSLHLLPSDQISAVFNRFHEQARGRLLKFCTYIYKNWIKSKVWPLENWSSFMEVMGTNNLTEGYHSRLKAKHVAQLDIYRIADLLFYESRIVTLNIQLLSQGQILQHKHTKDKTLQKDLFGLWGQYKDKEFGPFSLLSKVSNLYARHNNRFQRILENDEYELCKKSSIKETLAYQCFFFLELKKKSWPKYIIRGLNARSVA